MKRTIWGLLVAGWLPAVAYASNLANPLTPIPEARIAVGASYHLGGYTITNREIPAMLNRFHARVSYAPLSLLNFGLDAGASQVEVAADTGSADTLGVFHGNYGFSIGAHCKLATPLFLDDLLGLVAIGQATHFVSENDKGAIYEGFDGAAAAGVLLHIRGIGFAAAGAKLYMIDGQNKSYNRDAYNDYSNHNNVRGWLAFDYFPRTRMTSSNKPFISIEISLSPDAAFDQRAPVQEISFSAGIGSVTGRLYGERSELEWTP
jgi:hypothetical protein